MNNFPNLKNPIHFIATLGGVGKIPFAPGTWGSLFSFLLFIFLSHYIDMHAVVFLIILFSVWICEKASADLIEKDHSSIVIDELAGMWGGRPEHAFSTSRPCGAGAELSRWDGDHPIGAL